MKVPIIVFKTDKGFSATIVGLNYFYLCHETYDELESDFIKGIESGIRGLNEHNLKLPTSEEIIKELQEQLEIQEVEMIQSIEFIEYNMTV